MNNSNHSLLRFVQVAMVVGSVIILISALFQLLVNVPNVTYVGLLALAVAVSWPKFNLPIKAAEPLFFLVLLLHGTSAAILLSLIVTLIAVRSVFVTSKWQFFSRLGQAVLSAAAAGIVFDRLPYVFAQNPRVIFDSSVSLINILAWMAWVRFLFHADWVAVVAVIRAGKIREKFAQGLWLNSFVAYFGAAFTAGIVLLVTREEQPHVALLSVLIVTIFYFAYRHFKETYIQKYLLVQHNAEEVSDLHLRTIEAFSSAIEAKDSQAHLHARRIQIYTEGVGQALGLSTPELKALRAAALVRDIGKLAVPDHILHKTDKLTEAELEKVKLHPVVGAEILERVGFPYPIVPAVKHHHEHWDGSGYPDSLRGDAIPMTARVLAVADAFDGACGGNVDQLSRNQAVNLLQRESGHKYDPVVVQTLVAHLPELEAQVAELWASVPKRETGAAVAVTTPDSLAQVLYFDAIRRARQEGAELLELAQTLSSTLNLEEAVSIIISRLSRLTDFDTYAIYVTEDAGNAAYVAGAIGAHADALRAHHVLLGRGAIGQALATGHKVCSLHPATELAEFEPGLQQAFQSLTVLPLSKAGRVIGAIALWRKIADDDSENLRVIEMVVPLAADALFNAMAYRSTETRAVTDALTGLPNSRMLPIAFDEESNRADRYNTRLAMLMIDLDGFKQVNDTFGHLAGDQVLREVAHCLKQELRAYDKLIRYAGDEFVALLQHAEESSINDLIVRIQKYLESRCHKINGIEVRIGASIGYAIWGRDGHTLDELMRVADEGMYRNKALRKHQIKPRRSKPKAVPVEKESGIILSEALAS